MLSASSRPFVGHFITVSHHQNSYRNSQRSRTKSVNILEWKIDERSDHSMQSLIFSTACKSIAWKIEEVGCCHVWYVLLDDMRTGAIPAPVHAPVCCHQFSLKIYCGEPGHRSPYLSHSKRALYHLS